MLYPKAALETYPRRRRSPCLLCFAFAQALGCQRSSGAAPGPHALAFGVIDGESDSDEDEEAKREAHFQIAAMCGAKVRGLTTPYVSSTVLQ